MDLAFLTEMSNLSPPIIHSPPLHYLRTAPPHSAGQFSFGRLLRLARFGLLNRAARHAERTEALGRFEALQLAIASTQNQTIDPMGELGEVSALLRNTDKWRVSVHHAVAEPPGVRVFRV